MCFFFCITIVTVFIMKCCIFFVKYLIFISMWWLSSSSEEYRAKLKRVSLRLRDERSGCPIYDFFVSPGKPFVKGQIRKESLVYKNNLPRTRSPRLILFREIRGCFLCASDFSLRRSSSQSFVALTWEVFFDFLTPSQRTYNVMRKIYLVVTILDSKCNSYINFLQCKIKRNNLFFL